MNGSMCGSEARDQGQQAIANHRKASAGGKTGGKWSPQPLSVSIRMRAQRGSYTRSMPLEISVWWIDVSL